uniref:Uncharacterized protein n=1 Tax=Anguilla anguilla TaxID=7936 RepID=A0A0E9VH37_ANGAN
MSWQQPRTPAVRDASQAEEVHFFLVCLAPRTLDSADRYRQGKKATCSCSSKSWDTGGVLRDLGRRTSGRPKMWFWKTIRHLRKGKWDIIQASSWQGR